MSASPLLLQHAAASFTPLLFSILLLAHKPKSDLKQQPVGTCPMTESVTRLPRCVHALLQPDTFTALRYAVHAASRAFGLLTRSDCTRRQQALPKLQTEAPCLDTSPSSCVTWPLRAVYAAAAATQCAEQRPLNSCASRLRKLHAATMTSSRSVMQQWETMRDNGAHAVAHLRDAPCYESEGRAFDSR